MPGYRYLVAHTDLYATYGDFDEFCYQVFGILAYTGELTMSSEFAYRGRSDEPNGPDGNLWSRRPPPWANQRPMIASVAPVPAEPP